MARQIEILDGYDPSSYFWIGAVDVVGDGPIDEIDVLGYDDDISIEEGNVECFLYYFLRKHFDDDLSYNKMRGNDFDGRVSGFEWYLTHNFYTYERMELLLSDMEEKMVLLKNDFDNPELTELKKWFSIVYMCDDTEEDRINPKPDSIQRNIGVVIDFYGRFIAKIRNIMKNHSESHLITFLGP